MAAAWTSAPFKPGRTWLVDSTTEPDRVERGVLDVLTGTAMEVAAARISMAPSELSDAVDLYRAAGIVALERLLGGAGWHQVELRFPNPGAAEQIFAYQLGPPLRKVTTDGLISAWWFVRKASWRFRFQPGDGVLPEEIRAHLGRIFDELRDCGHIASWRETRYEPEVHAFGGAESMTVGHHLFHHDTRYFVENLHREDATAAGGRRELSMLLCSCLMRAAGQDWYEQGDIWARVARHRIDDSHAMPVVLTRLRAKVRRLMSVDAGPDSMLVRQGSLQFAAEWIGAFHEAGETIGSLAKDGKLRRGVRDVLAHHVIFHWNRMGLPASTQAVLASAAREVVFGS
jgi:thiopeptide-type bacteriocin biosynthesis protein